MSVHPEFTDQILAGEKRVEFRRRALGHDVSHIVLYATAPVGAVVGVAVVKRVERAKPSVLWAKFSSIGGIDRSRFMSYFEGRAEGVAYVIDSVIACETRVALGTSGLPIRPPQAYQYLDSTTLTAIMELGRRSTTSAGFAA